MNRVVFIAFLWLALVAVAVGQDPKPIEVVGPSSPIETKEWVLIHVNNLDETEFLASSITVVPKDNAVAFRVYGAPVLFFMSTKPGKFTVSVGRNVQHIEWQRSLSRALIQQKDVGLTGDFHTKLDKYIADAASAFPSRGGSCVVEVAGTIPFPPEPGPDPPDPNPPPTPPLTSGLTWTIVIRTVDTMTADQSQVLSDLRQWSDQQPADKVSHLEFSPRAEGPGGELDPKVATWVAKIPPAAKQPYVFISQKGADGKSVIHWQGELPSTADVLIAKIKELVR